MFAIFEKVTITSVVDILAVTVLIYNIGISLRGRRVMHILNGLAVLALVYGISVLLRLELLRTVLAALAPYTAIALIVMFQSEIRRLLARIGRVQWLGLGGQLERRELVDEIVLAVEQMAQDKTGALIVVEGEVGLRTFVESGVALDAFLSRDLLLSIFQRKGAMHDGAVIVQGDRVAAAACFLPLSIGTGADRKYGTRHLAALGVTEESDAIAVVVSEETGYVAMAVRGDFETALSIPRLRELLTHYASGRAGGSARVPRAEFKQAGL